MTADEFKERAKIHIIKKTKLKESDAIELAEAVFDNQDGVFCEAASANYDPEACVDEELSYWANEC